MRKAANRQTDRRKERQAGRRKDRQAGRQTDRRTDMTFSIPDTMTGMIRRMTAYSSVKVVSITYQL